jgi:hypothetical protein
VLPLDRPAACAAMAHAAEEAALEAAAGEGEHCECIDAYNRGHEQGGAIWDCWHDNACMYVDWLCGRFDDDAPDLAGETPSVPAAGAAETADTPGESPSQSFPWTPSRSSTSRADGEGAAMP